MVNKKIVGGWKKHHISATEFRFDNIYKYLSILGVKEEFIGGKKIWSSGVYNTLYHKKIINFKNSKTKISAIKYAKSWMKKHPKG